jgi:hypothetical protein
MDEQDIDVDTSGRALRWAVIGLLVVLVLVGIGAVGKFSGTGWFGWRQLAYDGGTLYVVNLGDSNYTVSVEGRKSHTLEPRGFQHIDLVGGTSEVAVRSDEGEARTFNITVDGSHAVLKLGGGCLAAADISEFYDRSKREMPRLKIVARIGEDQQVWVSGTTQVMWPQESLPKALPGGKGIWVESVGCAILDDTAYLEGYLRTKLQGRLRQQKEKKRQQ